MKVGDKIKFYDCDDDGLGIVVEVDKEIIRIDYLDVIGNIL